MHALPESRKSPQGVLTDATSREAARPLEGLRVLVTRPSSQADRLAPALVTEGATVDPVPTIRITDPPDLAPLQRAAAELGSYDWIVLSSPTGVEKLAVAATATDTFGRLRAARLAVIGPATADAARAFGLTPSVVPRVHRGEALADALIAAVPDISGMHILLARATDARQALPDRLRRAGALVDDVPAYVTRTEEGNGETLRALIDDGAVDWITFTASSTVTAYVELAGARSGGARVAAIGPITAETVIAEGLPEPEVAREATAAGLVDAIINAVSP